MHHPISRTTLNTYETKHAEVVVRVGGNAAFDSRAYSFQILFSAQAMTRRTAAGTNGGRQDQYM